MKRNHKNKGRNLKVYFTCFKKYNWKFDTGNGFCAKKMMIKKKKNYDCVIKY